MSSEYPVWYVVVRQGIAGPIVASWKCKDYKHATAKARGLRKADNKRYDQQNITVERRWEQSLY